MDETIGKKSQSFCRMTNWKPCLFDGGKVSITKPTDLSWCHHANIHLLTNILRYCCGIEHYIMNVQSFCALMSTLALMKCSPIGFVLQQMETESLDPYKLLSTLHICLVHWIQTLKRCGNCSCIFHLEKRETRVTASRFRSTFVQNLITSEMRHLCEIVVTRVKAQNMFCKITVTFDQHNQISSSSRPSCCWDITRMQWTWGLNHPHLWPLTKNVESVHPWWVAVCVCAKFEEILSRRSWQPKSILPSAMAAAS